MFNVFQSLSRFAKQLGIYDHIRHSALYQPLLKVRNPAYSKRSAEKIITASEYGHIVAIVA